ncbi:N-acetyltransferase family protein [Pseudonocardia sp. CA-107938]|uniref:GNAT family N-acetyltransferase n=1 Tax=Pseudonocardia sp. CA-107938 TaxID=3240021 RepID=UPI003D90F106
MDTVFAGLSVRSRYLRFHSPIPVLTPDLRRVLLPIDGHRRLAVAAWCGRVPLGIARVTVTAPGTADIAVAVVDAWQRRGLGRRLLAAVARLAERAGVTELQGAVLPDNVAMLGLVRREYPLALRHFDGDAVQLRIPIGSAAWTITDEDVYASLLTPYQLPR